MKNKEPIFTKKILIFLLLAFGISWLSALFLFLFSISIDSTFGKVICASFYMLSPTISVLITNKIIYKENFINYGLNFKNISLKGLFITPLVFIFSNLLLIFLIYWTF